MATRRSRRPLGHVFFRRRYLWQAPERTTEEYREVVVGDRKKTLNMCRISAERLDRGAEVSNRDPLPPASQSGLAAALQVWCEFNSWGICSTCKAAQPRDLTVDGMEKILSPYMPKSLCLFCKNVRAPPKVDLTADALRNLPAAIVAALRPVQPDFGPEERSRDRFGRGNGYRIHMALVTFAWRETSVEAQIEALGPELQRQARAALDWLLEHSGAGKLESAYGSFYAQHWEFLTKHPNAEPRQRRRWLRFLEAEGLECALWPHLFTQRQTCFTWHRQQSLARRARRGAAGTLEQRAFGGGAPVQETEEDVTSLKRSYMALVLSPALDFAMSYEVLHFAYDLSLWSDIGSKKNLHLGVPMRLLVKGHSFSSEYWRQMHRGLVDMIRQKGFPPLFTTHSPFEWTTPNHCMIVDAMEKTRRGERFLLLFVLTSVSLWP